MMRTLRKTIFTALLVTIAALASTSTGLAQYGSSNSASRDLVQRIQAQTNTLRSTVQNASERGNFRLDDFNRLVNDLTTATNQLDRRLSVNRATSADARLVLDRAALIDSFFVNNRIGFGTQREWQTLKTYLDQLASTYNLNTQWNSGGSTGSTGPNLNLSDAQLRQLVQRLDTRTTTFGRNLRQDLNSRRSSGRYSIEQIRQQLSAFESAEVQLRNRAYNRQVTSQDVQNLLIPATLLNSFIVDTELSYQTENNWTNLRQDLDRLASAYELSWNWQSTTATDGGYGNGRYGLIGTYRLNTTQGDDARRAVDNATRNVSAAERQRVYDSLLRRLDSPQMIAIDRRGNSVTIVSSRAPQINFVADGREQVETTNSGRTIRVRATLTGEQLTIARNGERANDFTVTFGAENGGRQLLVTRTLYSDRISQPIVVRSYYDRVSDVAQLNLYETNPEGSVTDTTTTSGNFVIPNGTQIVAVMDTNLSTKTAQPNDRFSMAVRSPGQFEGARIEGYVSSVNRGGRVTGRSEMTLDFDTIRMRDGRTYRFAGILESIRTSTGDVVQVDNEGAVQDSNQTNKTITRTAIGSAVGAIIGAIAGGGKGAAIGAAVGAGVGAGSVYVQGRNDLDLNAGTEVSVRATGPRG